MHAPEQEDPSPLPRHPVDEGLQPAQLVPSLDLALDGRLVRTQHVEVGHEIQRHDGLAPQGVDQQVACDGEEVGATGGDAGELLRLIGARQALGDEVVHIEARRADPPQPCAHRRFVRQHHGLEPLQPNEKLAHPAPPMARTTRM